MGHQQNMQRVCLARAYLSVLAPLPLLFPLSAHTSVIKLRGFVPSEPRSRLMPYLSSPTLTRTHSALDIHWTIRTIHW